METSVIDTLQLQWGVAIGASLIAAVTDLISRRIPNVLTFTVLAVGLVFAFATQGFLGLGNAFAACLILAFPFVVLFAFAGGGAGDAKLMGAVGAWLGVTHGVIALATVCITGIFLAIFFALRSSRLKDALQRVSDILKGFFFVLASRSRLSDLKTFVPETTEMQKIPYGISIFLGVTLAAVGTFAW